MQKTSEEIFEGDGVPQMIISGETFRLLENTQPEIVESLKNKEDIWESELTNFIFIKFPKFEKVKKEIINKMKKIS